MTIKPWAKSINTFAQSYHNDYTTLSRDCEKKNYLLFENHMVRF